MLPSIKSTLRILQNESGWLLGRVINSAKNYDHDYSIGVTTFIDRFGRNFKKQLSRLNYLFPLNQILVAVNGHYDQQQQVEYLDQVKKFCGQYGNVEIFTYDQPQGLSRLWNQLILRSRNERIIILNDDLLISYFFRKNLEGSGVLQESVALLNNSWAHFLISRQVIKLNGWFDERFVEIGGEDDDFHVRLAINGLELPRYNVPGIRNLGLIPKINSYGQADSARERYSKKNTDFLYRKWTIAGRPFDQSHYIVKSQGNYWKLNKDMETPEFYNETWNKKQVS
jgi:hypothetical protein